MSKLFYVYMLKYVKVCDFQSRLLCVHFAKTKFFLFFPSFISTLVILHTFFRITLNIVSSSSSWRFFLCAKETLFFLVHAPRQFFFRKS